MRGVRGEREGQGQRAVTRFQGPRIRRVILPGPGQPRARLSGGPRIVGVVVPGQFPKSPSPKASLTIDRPIAILIRKACRREKRDLSSFLLTLLREYGRLYHPEWELDDLDV